MPPQLNPEPPAEDLNVVDLDLTAYDEALRDGSASVDLRVPGDAAGDELDELKECVRLLHCAWPSVNGATRQSPIPARLGRFEIERVLGYGGFGIVYLATDPILKRFVALKVPRLHSLADDRLLERFRREGRAAASLDHPNIVPIHETGAEGGLCYLAAVYCPGPNLAEWLKQQTTPVSPRLAASLVARLANAIHYSHTRGVLHRDLKPGNVLLVPRAADAGDGADELPFIPRVTDFGLARLLEDDGHETAASTMMGTPNYMAPEQAGRDGGEIGPATDVYGLGVILYELLVGRPPFQSESFVDVVDQVRLSDPVPPRRLRRDVPVDLEIICLKCLEKHPAERYASARELFDDLQHFLRGEPLRARRPGRAHVAIKWARRRPLAAALAAAAALITIGGPALLISHNRQLSLLTTDLSRSLHESREWQHEAEAQRTVAEAAAREAEEGRDAAEAARSVADVRSRERAQLAYASAVHLAELAWRDFDLHQCRALLARALEQTDSANPPGLEWKFLDYRTRAASIELGEPLEYFCSVAASPAGDVIAAGGAGGVVQLIEAASGIVRGRLRTSHGVARALAFSRKGDRLAVCGDDGTVSVWNVASQAPAQSSPVMADGLAALVWLAEDNWIATAGSLPAIRLWKVPANVGASENELFDLDTAPHKVTSIAASHDGLRLAAGDHDGTIHIWNAPSWELAHRFPNGHVKVTSLEFTRAGNHLAVGDNDQFVRLYRTSGAMPTKAFEVQLRDDIRSLAFSPSDERLAVLEKFGSLHVWTLSLVQPKPARMKRYQHGWLAHEERGSQLVFLEDGSRLVSVGRGSARPRSWPTAVRPATALLPGPPLQYGPRFELLFTPDSTRLIAGGPQVEVWSTGTPKRLRALTETAGGRESLALTADARWLAAGSRHEKIVELWDTDGTWSAPRWRLADRNADSLAFSPSGEELAIVDWAKDLLLIVDRARGEQRRSLAVRQCHAAAWSPDGRVLAVDELDDVVLWNTDTWSVARRLRGHLSTIQTLAFSADGHWLASAGDDRLIRLWDTQDWSCPHVLNGHREEVQSIAFTPDSRSLLALDADSFLKVWHVATGLELCSLYTRADGRIARFALSPDATRLAVRREDGRLEMHRLREKEE